MGKLIILRHGQSIYNAQNLFTGWSDIDLSEQGVQEAKEAGLILKKAGIYPDIVFTSWLKRSIHTAQLALKEMAWEHIDVLRSWRLNERHYGAWQKRNKDEVKSEVGEEMFLAIRRGYDTPPPPLSDGDERLPQNDLKYHNLSPTLLPRSESLADTRERTLYYYYQKIVPYLIEGKTVLVSAHGNSLRALSMEIEGLSREEVVKLEIPTGKPVLYRFDNTMKLIDKTGIKG